MGTFPDHEMDQVCVLHDFLTGKWFVKNFGGKFNDFDTYLQA